ncbi:hypothetical protein M2271_006738 [Streptomyces sp. LBL]|uniref:hypothetical protein n=1 Tax=Streptomyces sp. LBL TaxID=2940562 RepID=UPI002475477A|nr:hypothetical protein [Streptomyces sp. LBL]MDH6628903.1 hypothetical protein [Streptomyces sp. LBL]
MRTRAKLAAVSALTGALALTALAAPAAQAADSGTPYTLDVSFSNFKIASAIKVGTTNVVSAKVTYTLTHGTGVNITADDFFTDAFLYRGSYPDDTNELLDDDFSTCTATSSTAATCTGTVDIHPADGDLTNADAGSWHAAAEATAFNGQDPSGSSIDYSKVGYKDQGALAATLVQRNSALTVNAGPEPVVKGKTITSTGKLSRANWEDGQYHGYTAQPVKLQFRKAGTSTYTTVKTVTSDSYGNVKATATAAYDGYWRFSFAGTSTTPAVSAAGDYVDVK